MHVFTAPARAALLAFALLLHGCALDEVVTAADAGAPPNRDAIAAGLKEALRIGTERAVADTSRRGGFLDDPLLRIALPEQLADAVEVLRGLGLGGLVDGFEASMNRAAERAASAATPVFVDAISALTLADVYGIYNGGPTAATGYFRARTGDALRARFRPIVEQSMRSTGVYPIYQDLITPYQRLPFVSSIKLDLGAYITERALDGLFTALGEEEARIRENPLARTTALLRRVFGGG